MALPPPTERRKALALTAGELTTSPAVVTLSGKSIAAAARLMDREDVKGLPVTDDLGRRVDGGVAASSTSPRRRSRPMIRVRGPWARAPNADRETLARQLRPAEEIEAADAVLRRWAVQRLPD
jgi:CBS-domain-containing membrane protein